MERWTTWKLAQVSSLTRPFWARCYSNTNRMHVSILVGQLKSERARLLCAVYGCGCGCGCGINAPRHASFQSRSQVHCTSYNQPYIPTCLAPTHLSPLHPSVCHLRPPSSSLIYPRRLTVPCHRLAIPVRSQRLCDRQSASALRFNNFPTRSTPPSWPPSTYLPGSLVHCSSCPRPLPGGSPSHRHSRPPTFLPLFSPTTRPLHPRPTRSPRPRPRRRTPPARCPFPSTAGHPTVPASPPSGGVVVVERVGRADSASQ
jgi:hypothetical protein